jgi:hypothetical protein
MLQTHEILDRYEILYPQNENLSNLRRAYVDKDLSSIFKLSTADDDIRKAVLEKNLHSLFRLIDSPEDIRKAIVEKNLHSLFRLIDAPEDLRKSILEKNIHSLFRLIADCNIVQNNIDDLRKAVTEENIHSIFRLIDAPEDLRKAVTEENLYSIFRLIDAPEDLRKAVTEENLYSIFRLIDTPEDLRKAVTEENLNSILRLVDLPEDVYKLIVNDNQWSLWRILQEYTNTSFTKSFKKFFAEGIEYDKDCFSQGQLKSKKWLIRELEILNLPLGTVFLCAGWYATLATMIFESNIKVDKITSFDIDETCATIAETFNKKWVIDNWKFKSITKDIHELNFNKAEFDVHTDNGVVKIVETPDTIINTSCEHIDNFDKWYAKIQKGQLVILQSNDYFEIEDHVNCVSNVAEFSDQTPMTTVLFEGELELDKYKRFMKIGYR